MVVERESESRNKEGNENMTSHHYENLRASLVKMCKDVISEQALENFLPFDFDTHASLNDIPDSDLLGIAEMQVTNSEGTYETTCKVVVCTKTDDTYLERLLPVVDAVFDKLRPGYGGIKIVQASDGRIIGNFKVEDQVSIFPVAVSKGRPLQVIGLRLASSLIVPP